MELIFFIILLFLFFLLLSERKNGLVLYKEELNFCLFRRNTNRVKTHLLKALFSILFLSVRQTDKEKECVSYFNYIFPKQSLLYSFSFLSGSFFLFFPFF